MVLHLDARRSDTHSPSLYSCICVLYHFSLHFICTLFQYWMSLQTEVKAEQSLKWNLNLLVLLWCSCEGLCLSSDLGLEILGEVSGVKRGWGSCCLPQGREEVLQKTLPVTSGPLQTVNHALRQSASAQQPQLPPQLEMQYATYPRRWDHPGGIWGHSHTHSHTQKNKCACAHSITHTHTQSNTYRSTHM